MRSQAEAAVGAQLARMKAAGDLRTVNARWCGKRRSDRRNRPALLQKISEHFAVALDVNRATFDEKKLVL
jgi:hypothetical protein